MNAHEKNSAICGHLLVAWAMLLHVVGLASCPVRAIPVAGLVCAALALFASHVASGTKGFVADGTMQPADAVGLPALYFLSAAFTFLAWLLFVVGALWS